MDSPEELFVEHPSTVVITCAANKVEAVQQIAAAHNISAWRLGQTGGEFVSLSIEGGWVARAKVVDLQRVFKNALAEQLEAEVVLA